MSDTSNPIGPTQADTGVPDPAGVGPSVPGAQPQGGQVPFTQALGDALGGIANAIASKVGLANPDSSGGTSVDVALPPDAQKKWNIPKQDPYKQSAEQISAIVSESPSPFTMIDITAFIANQKALPPSNGTIQAIVAYFNLSLGYGFPPSAPVATGGAASFFQSFLRTISVTSPGNTIRVERLPPGIYVKGNALGNQWQRADSNSNTLADASNVEGIDQGGVFIQTEDQNAPVMRVQPGQTYYLPFNTVLISFLQMDCRYRVILGRNAEVRDNSVDAILNQSLHMGEGGGLWTNPMYKPVPFCLAVGSLVSQLGVGQTVTFGSLVSCYDAGSQIVRSAAPNGIFSGYTSNLGYGVLWITRIDAYANFTGSVNGPAWQWGIQLWKGRFSGNVGGTVWGQNTILADIFKPTGSGVAYFNITAPIPPVAGMNAPLSNPMQFVYNPPMRVVLAGFDLKNLGSNSLSRTESGEVLFWNSVLTMSSTGNLGGEFGIAISGYSLGAMTNLYPTLPSATAVAGMTMIPFNPWPQDVNLDQSAPFP